VASGVRACGFDVDDREAFHGAANIPESTCNLRMRSTKDLRCTSIAVNLGHERKAGNVFLEPMLGSFAFGL
jgi:hypothetical protein